MTSTNFFYAMDGVVYSGLHFSEALVSNEDPLKKAFHGYAKG
jgi:hypothetical protein